MSAINLSTFDLSVYAFSIFNALYTDSLSRYVYLTPVESIHTRVTFKNELRKTYLVLPVLKLNFTTFHCI